MAEDCIYAMADIQSSNQNYDKDEFKKNKIANMVNATAVTIPSKVVASGIVMISREGIDNGIRLIKLAKKLSALNVIV